VTAKPDGSPRAGGEPVRLRRLLPPGGDASAFEIVEELGLWERPQAVAGRPRVLLNMVSTVDGRATLGGRSGAIGGPADRELFRALRTVADGVLAGAGTVRTERYRRLVPDAERRALRAQRGLAEEPLACVVSGRVALQQDIPLLAEPEARVVIVTSSEASVPSPAASVRYVRCSDRGRIDLPRALEELHTRFEIELLLCEGGPHLALELLAGGLVDDLFLSLSPLLAGGEPSAGEALRITAGPELDPPAPLALATVLESDSSLFLRYRATPR
jgi:riboflavin biosynthesis pyrimidine reductase